MLLMRVSRGYRFRKIEIPSRPAQNESHRTDQRESAITLTDRSSASVTATARKFARNQEPGGSSLARSRRRQGVGRRSRNSAGECSRLEAREGPALLVWGLSQLLGPGPRRGALETGDWRLAIIKNTKKEPTRDTTHTYQLRTAGRETRTKIAAAERTLRCDSSQAEPKKNEKVSS